VDDPLTTNNDTPQMPGEEARQDAVSDTEWREGAGDPDLAGSGLPDDPASTAETGEANGTGETAPQVPWTDWAEGTGVSARTGVRSDPRRPS